MSRIDVLARALIFLAFRIAPASRREWSNAAAAEAAALSGTARVRWAFGGLLAAVALRLADIATDPWMWSAAAVIGVTAALADLRLLSRAPYLGALVLAGATLTFVRPRQSWRWAAMLALSLPLVVVLTGNWGPYQHDQFDAFYGIVPALGGMVFSQCVTLLARVRS